MKEICALKMVIYMSKQSFDDAVPTDELLLFAIYNIFMVCLGKKREEK